MYCRWRIILALLFAVNVSALDLVIGGCELPSVTESGADYVGHERWDFEVTVNGQQFDFWLSDCSAKITNIPNATYSIRYRASGDAGYGSWLSLGTWTIENDRIAGSENPELGSQKRFWFEIDPDGYVEPWTLDGSQLEVGEPVAITVNNHQTGTLSFSSDSDLTLSSYNVGAGSDRVLVVYVQTEQGGGPSTVSSVEYGGSGGDAFTSADSINEGINHGSMWYLNEADIGSGSQTKDILITFSGSTAQASAHAIWLDSASQSGPTQTATNSNSGASETAISATLNSVAANAIIINGGGHGDTNAMTQDGGQTILSSLASGSAVGALAHEIPGSGNHTQGWTFSASRRPNIILAEWAEASGGASNAHLFPSRHNLLTLLAR